ncbi:hypothetical protein QBC44DRAFT_389932 [Cladorrhinum sp. PSN332]|nr:hypothetical protein QBC44DRAFT_389932 [Cladorrhinum sp. PSN332]
MSSKRPASPPKKPPPPVKGHSEGVRWLGLTTPPPNSTLTDGTWLATLSFASTTWSSATPLKSPSPPNPNLDTICARLAEELKADLETGNVQSVIASIPGFIETFSSQLQSHEEVELSSQEKDHFATYLCNLLTNEEPFLLDIKAEDEGDDYPTKAKGRSALTIPTLAALFKTEGVKNGRAGGKILGTIEFPDDIWESPTYKRLRSSLRQTLQLQGPKSTEPHENGAQEVMKTVVGALPRYGMATFWLPWLAFNAVQAASCWGHKLKDRLTLTMSSEGHLQLTTVGQYVTQTWPYNHTSILDLLQGEGDTEVQESAEVGWETRVYLKEGATAIMYTQQSGIKVGLCGHRHIIADAAEQLAWLVAALSPNSGYEDSWDLTAEYQPIPPGPTLDLLNLLDSEFSAFPFWPTQVVCGFPTLYRPIDALGLEISQAARVQLCSVFSQGLTVFGSDTQRTGLQVGFTSWRLAKPDSSAVATWHEDSKCECGMKAPESLSKATKPPAHCRWVLGVCPASGAGVSDTATAVSDTGQHLLASGNDVEAELPQTTVPGSPKSDMSDVSSLSESHPSDMDLLSVSDNSEPLIGGMESLFAAQPAMVSQAIDKITHQLLKDFRESHMTWHNSELPAPNPSSTVVSQAVTSVQGSNTQTRKRKHTDANDHNQDNGEDEGNPGKRPKPESPNKPVDKVTNKLQLACHFWKLNPRKHKRCFMKKLDDTSRVKQHLTRTHYRSSYCPRCFLVLEDDEAVESHLDPVTCLPRQHDFGLMTNGQHQKVNRRSNTKHSESEKWYAIWDILFPGQCRLPSPYIDPLLSEDLGRFVDHARLQGPSLIAALLRVAGVRGCSLPSLEQVISQGLDALIEMWLAADQSVGPPSVPHMEETGSSDASLSHVLPGLDNTILEVSVQPSQVTPQSSVNAHVSATEEVTRQETEETAGLWNHQGPAPQTEPARNTFQDDVSGGNSTYQGLYEWPPDDLQPFHLSEDFDIGLESSLDLSDWQTQNPDLDHMVSEALGMLNSR